MGNSVTENTCRICFQIQDTLFSLYWKRKGLSPYEKLVKKTALKIHVNDDGPSSICAQCLIELDTTFNFLEKCEKSNELFTNYFSRGEDLRDLEQDKGYTEASLHIEKQDLEVKPKFKEVLTEVAPVCSTDVQCEKCGPGRRCRHRISSPKTHMCQYCQKVFTRKYNFTLHIKRHLGERDWPCPKCGISQLTRWLARRHCGPRPQRHCPEPGCGKSFTTNTNLKTHIRVHKGERPHVCAECGKGFFCKDTLNTHIRIHTGAKPYICPVCGAQFRTNKLSSHMATHAPTFPGPRPHTCRTPGCSRTFRSLPALTRHARSHTPTHTHTSHRCALCPKVYVHKQSLNKHVRNAHARVLTKPSDCEETHDKNVTDLDISGIS